MDIYTSQNYTNIYCTWNYIMEIQAHTIIDHIIIEIRLDNK